MGMPHGRGLTHPGDSRAASAARPEIGWPLWAQIAYFILQQIRTTTTTSHSNTSNPTNNSTHETPPGEGREHAHAAAPRIRKATIHLLTPDAPRPTQEPQSDEEQARELGHRRELRTLLPLGGRLHIPRPRRVGVRRHRRASLGA